MNSEYRQKLLSLQGRLTCIQTELTEARKKADKQLIEELPPKDDPVHHSIGGWYFWDETWSAEIGPYSSPALCRRALHTYSKNLTDSKTHKTDYLPHDFCQGSNRLDKEQICRICGEAKEDPIHTSTIPPKPELPIKSHKFTCWDTQSSLFCSKCSKKESHPIHITPRWKDITCDCTLEMKVSTYPPEGRVYGTLVYRDADIAHLVVDEGHYPILPNPNDGLIRNGAHLILALVDKKDYRVRIQKRCWSIQRRFD